MNIDGITILQTIPAFAWDIPIWVFLIGIILGFCCGFVSLVVRSDLLSLIFLFCCVLLIVFCIIVPVAAHPVRYKVIVNDSISYNKLCNNYDVVETEGKIITIQKKEN